jgi:hypothetical protein
MLGKIQSRLREWDYIFVLFMEDLIHLSAGFGQNFAGKELITHGEGI